MCRAAPTEPPSEEKGGDKKKTEAPKKKSKESREAAMKKKFAAMTTEDRRETASLLADMMTDGEESDSEPEERVHAAMTRRQMPFHMMVHRNPGYQSTRGPSEKSPREEDLKERLRRKLGKRAQERAKVPTTPTRKELREAQQLRSLEAGNPDAPGEVQGGDDTHSIKQRLLRQAGRRVKTSANEAVKVPGHNEGMEAAFREAWEQDADSTPHGSDEEEEPFIAVERKFHEMTIRDIGLTRRAGVITHKIFDKRTKRFMPAQERQGTLEGVVIHVDWEIYRKCKDIKQIQCRARGTKIPTMTTTVVADGGATMNTCSMRDARKMGVREEELEKSAIQIMDASHQPMPQLGMFFAKFWVKDPVNNKWIYSRGPMYVRDKYDGGVYLGQDTLVDLGATEETGKASTSRGRGYLHGMKHEAKPEAKTSGEDNQGSQAKSQDLTGRQRLIRALGKRDTTTAERKAARGKRTPSPPGEDEGERRCPEPPKKRRVVNGHDVPSAMLFHTMVMKQIRLQAELYGKCPETQDEEGNRTCGCPERVEVPDLSEEDLGELWESEIKGKPREEVQDWITERFMASSLNNCRMQVKPVETGSPPIKLNVRPTHKPINCTKPSQVSLPMIKPVFKQLQRDERMGIISKVPPNTPATHGCSRMVVVAKADGTPRRTVDFKALNMGIPRQAHSTEAPFNLCCQVKPGTLRTVLDATDGYHSIELAEEDRMWTMFITREGRYIYNRLPQGLLVAGDAYTERMDSLTALQKHSGSSR